MAHKINEQDIQTCLQNFLNFEDKTQQNQSAPNGEVAGLVREANSTYVMNDNKYVIKRKNKEAMVQYSNLYFRRLKRLLPQVKQAAEMKWTGHGEQQLVFVDNILDIKPFEGTVIIGTLFKEQKLKPSILNNIMGVLGQNKFYDSDTGKFQYGKYVNKDEKDQDVPVLEDISGRITIKDSPNFRIDEFVSGTIVALKGRAVNGGYFEV